MSEDSTNRKQESIRILLMIAKFMASDRWGKEIGDLATHISGHADEIAA